MKQGFRKAAKGTTTIPADTIVTLATITRNIGELLFWGAFITSQVAGIGLTLSPIGYLNEELVEEHIAVYIESTTILNEYILKGYNSGGVSRTIDWAVVGFIPL